MPYTRPLHLPLSHITRPGNQRPGLGEELTGGGTGGSRGGLPGGGTGGSRGGAAGRGYGRVPGRGRRPEGPGWPGTICPSRPGPYVLHVLSCELHVTL